MTLQQLICFLFVFRIVDPAPFPVSESIRLFVENKPLDGRYQIDSKQLYASNVLPQFYEQRQFKEAWFSESGNLSQSGIGLIAYLRNADAHGLQPGDYHLPLIRALHEALQSSKTESRNEMIMKMDLLLSDAFFLMGAHLSFGKVDPESIAASWKIQRNQRELRLDLQLENALRNRTVTQTLEGLVPQTAQYRALKSALVQFRKKEPLTWKNIVIDQSIKPGNDHLVLPEIRRRIVKLGLPLADTAQTTYDSELEVAVRNLQRRWGMNPDGVIGKNTVEILNIQPEEFVKKLVCNMERLRWMPDTLPQKLIEVNIANFELDFIVESDTVFRTRAIVGKSYRKTPVFNASMTYMVLSPGWVIPPGILANDVLPELRKGPAYLQEKNMQIMTYTGTRVDYHSIDWTTVTVRNFRYMIRQAPGPLNALGRVKFMFPNSYNVYIHDTPTRNLFTADTRTFSSGCIRIENPLKLAEILLEDQPEWDAQRVSKAAESGKEHTVRLLTPIPVHLTYFTCWADASGRYYWRRDIYDRDEPLAQALREKPVFR